MQYNLEIEGKTLQLSNKETGEILFICKRRRLLRGTKILFYNSLEELILEIDLVPYLLNPTIEILFQKLPCRIFFDSEKNNLFMQVDKNRLFIKFGFISLTYPKFYRNEVFCGAPVLTDWMFGLFSAMDARETYEFDFVEEDDDSNLYFIIFFMIRKARMKNWY